MVHTLLYRFNNIVLTNIDYSCTGVPILVDICPCDHIKYGCICIKPVHAYNYSKCSYCPIKNMVIDPDNICCDIFQLQFSDLCERCQNKLLNLLQSIMRRIYYLNDKNLLIIRNELFENFIIRFSEILIIKF